MRFTFDTNAGPIVGLTAHDLAAAKRQAEAQLLPLREPGATASWAEAEDGWHRIDIIDADATLLHSAALRAIPEEPPATVTIRLADLGIDGLRRLAGHYRNEGLPFAHPDLQAVWGEINRREAEAQIGRFAAEAAREPGAGERWG